MARLGPDDWCREALLAFGEDGEKALNVERLAKRLGVTKGSFYWHFDNKGALLTRALAHWQQVGTDEIVARLDALPSPQERLAALFNVAIRDPRELRAEAALQAAAMRGHPVIGPVVSAVNRARRTYLRGLYATLGKDPGWADTAYATYLGACQLVGMDGDPFDAAQQQTLVDRMIERLVP